MLVLKEVNVEDAAKEFEFFKKLPKDDNGYYNPYFNATVYDFYKDIDRLIANGRGEQLQSGEVPCTYYFLWDDDVIVGQFKVRHRLNALLKLSGGHIAFAIAPEHRNKGYGKAGLKMAIEKLKKMGDFRDNEIYIDCYEDNIASLKVQQANGARLYKNEYGILHNRIKVR